MNSIKKTTRELKPYFMVMYPLLIVLIFSIYPFIKMIFTSFHDWNMVSPTMDFVGFENYKNIVQSREFYKVVYNTFYYTFWSVFFSIGLSILLAFYLKENSLINRILQSVIFSPFIVSMASISLIWLWLMNNELGFLNYILNIFGLNSIDWLGSSDHALNSLIIISVWKSIGYNTLLMLGALQNIPSYLYEAASLDKASSWTTFRRITLPMISPTIMFLVITRSIGAIKVFDLVSIITQGGPKNSTKTLVYSLYQHGFEYYDAGTASALGFILFMILALMTLIYFRIFSNRVHYR